MPDKNERIALDTVKGYLASGQSLEAVRAAGWSEWIDHLESNGYDIRTGERAKLPALNAPRPTKVGDITASASVPDNSQRFLILGLAAMVVALVGIVVFLLGDGLWWGKTEVNVFEVTRPSLAYIETDGGTGSGVFIDEDGHVLTNFHVIADSIVIDVVLADGTTFEDVAVVGFDRRADLAVLQVPTAPDASFRMIEVSDSDDLAIGDIVHALGFPFEGGTEIPTLQLSSGVVSATRESVLEDVSFIQTDAAFNAGISGGALVDGDGRLVGIPTLLIDEGTPVGLAIEASDALSVASDIISSRTGVEPIDAQQSKTPAGTINDFYDAAGYRVWLEDGEKLEVTVESDADVALSLTDPFGYEVVLGDELTAAGTETAAYEALGGGPYTVAVINYGGYGTGYSISASHLLAEYLDVEDGTSLSDQSLIGELQFPGDEDTLLLFLREGQTVTVTLRSWDFDAILQVLSPKDPSFDEIDDDSALGLFGGDATITYTAGEEGEHEIIVSAYAFLDGDSYLIEHGFYKATVQD